MSRTYRIYKEFRDMGIEPNGTYGFDDWLCFGNIFIIAVRLNKNGFDFIGVRSDDKEQTEFIAELSKEEKEAMYDYIEHIVF